MIIIIVVFSLIARTYNIPLTSWKGNNDGHSIAGHASVSHKPTHYSVYSSFSNYNKTTKHEKKRNKTGKVAKRTFAIKVFSKNRKGKVRGLSHATNVKLLKVLMLYTLDVMKISRRYSKLLNRSHDGDLRSGVDRYVKMRDKIARFAQLLDAMEWNDTSDHKVTQDKDNTSYKNSQNNGSSSHKKGNFYLSPTKFNSLLDSLGSDEMSAPENKSEEHGKKNTTTNDSTVTNTPGDTGHELLTSKNVDSAKDNKLVTGSISENNSSSTESGEDQVADILQKLQNILSANDTQSKTSQQKGNLYPSPTKLNSLLESLGSDQLSAPENKSEDHRKENSTKHNSAVVNTHGDTDYELLTSPKMDNAKGNILKMATSISETNSSTSKFGEDEVADILQKLQNLFYSEPNNHNVANITNSQKRNSHNDSSDNSSIPFPSKVTNQTSNDVEISSNSSKRSEDVTQGRSSAKDDISSILATLLNSNQTRDNVTTRGEDRGTEEANNTTEVNNSNNNNNNNKQVQLSIILKYERLLKLLHSKLTSGGDWKQNTFLNISVAKFEKLLDSLTTELTFDLGNAKGDHNKNGKHKGIGKHKAHSLTPTATSVSDLFLNISYSDDQRKPPPQTPQTPQTPPAPQTVVDKYNNNNNIYNTHTVDVTPSSSVAPPSSTQFDGIHQLPYSNQPKTVDDKSGYVNKVVENTRKYHSNTMTKFKQLLQLISFRNLIRGLPHMRVDDGEQKHVDYYSFNDQFVSKIDNLMKLLAFNRIFDDTSPSMRRNEDAKKHDAISAYHDTEKLNEKWHWRIV